MNTDVSSYPMLPEALRIAAREVARGNVVKRHGQRPVRDQFKDYAASKYPGWFRGLVGFALLVVGLASGWISAVRLYKAGYDYAAQTVSGPNWIAVSIGVCTPLAAEFLIIVAAIASRVYLRDRGRRWAFLPVLVGTIVGFVGNWTITQPDMAWGWVVTFFPPVAVLSTALIFEMTLVPELERRQSNEVAFQAALERYEKAIADPETYSGWRDSYAFALWEAWKRKQRKLAAEMSVEVRDQIILREMAADRFFTGNTHEYSPTIQAKPDEQPGAQKERVKEYLTLYPEDRALTLTELSEKIGVSYSTVQRVVKEYSKNGHDRRDE